MLIFQLMYKYIGIALMSVFAIMMIPAQSQTNAGPTFYGMGSLILHDAEGNEVFTQSIHNRVVDQGEAFIIDQVFQEGGTDVAETSQFASICVSRAANFATILNETLTASGFDGNDAITTGTNCQEDTTVDDTTASTAVILPAAFGTSALDATGQTITGIGVCQAHTSSTFSNCVTAGGGSGRLLAAIDTSDVTLNSGETVTITYTFDIVSAST